MPQPRSIPGGPLPRASILRHSRGRRSVRGPLPRFPAPTATAGEYCPHSAPTLSALMAPRGLSGLAARTLRQLVSQLSAVTKRDRTRGLGARPTPHEIGLADVSCRSRARQTAVAPPALATQTAVSERGRSTRMPSFIASQTRRYPSSSTRACSSLSDPGRTPLSSVRSSTTPTTQPQRRRYVASAWVAAADGVRIFMAARERPTAAHRR